MDDLWLLDVPATATRIRQYERSRVGCCPDWKAPVRYVAGLLGLLSLYLCVREIIAAFDARYFPVLAATFWIVVTLVAAGACFTFATRGFRAHR